MAAEEAEALMPMENISEQSTQNTAAASSQCTNKMSHVFLGLLIGAFAQKCPARCERHSYETVKSTMDVAWQARQARQGHGKFSTTWPSAYGLERCSRNRGKTHRRRH